MRLKVLGVFVVLAAVVTATAAAKGGPPGDKERRGEPVAARVTVDGERCRKHPLVFAGNVASASATAVTVTVALGNRHARALVGNTVGVALDAQTKLRPKGATAADLTGKRVRVEVRRCNASAPLLAVKLVVQAQPAAGAARDETTG